MWFLLSVLVRLRTPIITVTRWFIVLMCFGTAAGAGIAAGNDVLNHYRTPTGSERVDSTVVDRQGGACQIDFVLRGAPHAQWIGCPAGAQLGDHTTLLYYAGQPSRSEAAPGFAVEAEAVAVVGGLVFAAIGLMFLRVDNQSFERYARARVGGSR